LGEPRTKTERVQARTIWWFVAVAIAGAGIAGIVKIYSQSGIGYTVPLTLLATVVCGAVGLAGLALLDRGLLQILGLALLLTAVVTYVLLELGTWDDGFAERHPRVVATTAILAIFSAFIGTLATMIRAAPQPLRLVTLAAQTVIAATATYSISLVWTISEQRGPSRTEGRALELLVILSLVGYLTAPVIQRALQPATPAPPSS
jgi:FtsH-binding integral membrane protein